MVWSNLGILVAIGDRVCKHRSLRFALNQSPLKYSHTHTDCKEILMNSFELLELLKQILNE